MNTFCFPLSCKHSHCIASFLPHFLFTLEYFFCHIIWSYCVQERFHCCQRRSSCLQDNSQVLRRIYLRVASMAQKMHYKGDSVVRYEPTYMKLFEEDPVFIQYFASMGCLCFCEKLQVFHVQIAKCFSIKLTRIETKVGLLNFAMSPNKITHATKIPCSVEMWFKVQKFQLLNCDEFLKEEYIGIYMTTIISGTFLKDNFSKLLMVIQKYFTCEGIFNMVYQQHFRLLLNFTGKQSLDIPFYLFRILGKMADKVQAKPDASNTSAFHYGLIKLLVVEELNSLNGD